jgi:hypothetical protein
MQDHYTTEQLKERGWTSSMIKAHLGKADEQRSNPNGPLRKPVNLYRIERVHVAEAGPASSDMKKQDEAVSLAKRALQLKKSRHAT